MSELSKAYEPSLVEDKLYKFWKESGFFKADANSSKPPYTIVIPPPNVTGTLHMGHALVDTLQDVLIRYKRMNGFEALWVPGTDHAGIATQTVVERNLLKEYGKRRKDFTREEFLKHVWDWKEKSETRILQQLERLGCSCDWSRLAFTMDEKRNKAVRTLFKKMFDDGLIYRGDYLVNWDPVTQTALADDEVEYEEKDSFLWHFRYPAEDGSEGVTIATTRPETMLGDVAVAVSPSDNRYKHLVGKKLKLPLTGRIIPVIEDSYVDPTFGTGVVKITPAHDPNDYEMGIRHSLQMINIMTPDGKINENGGEFQGLSMEEARHAIIAKLKEMGLLVKAEPHKNRVGVSYRSKAVIEPYLSKQWFVKLSHFKKQLRGVVESKKVKLVPENWENTYYYWIDNLRDWCISRQLWWGHRIPIWYHKEDPNKLICYSGEDIPPEIKQEPEMWTQDEDVLDTWFSSALWPFSTMGWPDSTPDVKRFYPNSTLITGHDILFFWVARMILMGLYTMGEVPFPETFLHGLIYGKSYWSQKADGSISYITGQERLDYDLGKPLPNGVHYKWEKMSKSKGNVIDPLEIIDSYGTDAMRMALCASATQARQIDLDRRRFEEFKNFANKVWNGARFVFMNLEDFDPSSLSSGLDINSLELEDRWILKVLDKTIESVQDNLDNYQFDKAALSAYDFFWKEFCAYYVEAVKPVLFGKRGDKKLKETKQKVLIVTLLAAIRLMHPMAPFITEELFQYVKEKFSTAKDLTSQDPYILELLNALRAPACIVSSYPKPFGVITDDHCEKDFDLINGFVYAIRNIRAEMQLPPSVATDIHFVSTEDNALFGTLQSNEHLIHSLVKVNALHFSKEDPKLAFFSSSIIEGIKIILPLPQEMQQKEKQRLEKEKEKVEGQLQGLEQRLSNPSFTERAPKQLVDQTLAQKEQLLTLINDINQKLALFH